MKISATILAAGSSNRMGDLNKLLLLINERPIINLVCTTALETNLNPIVVVTGYQHIKVEKAIPNKSVRLIHNKNWKKGMMSSICVGISVLDESVNGNMIILGDMPFITKDTLDVLIKKFIKYRGQNIIFPLYKSKQANPVIFPKKLFPEILLSRGDIGCKKIIEKYKQNTTGVTIDSDEVILDCDTRDDYLLAQMKKTNHVQT
tara:strand:- start:473 stop:1084 length:612 start_codon:yes stop_codon:yes gene_type:complete